MPAQLASWNCYFLGQLILTADLKSSFFHCCSVLSEELRGIITTCSSRMRRIPTSETSDLPVIFDLKLSDLRKFVKYTGCLRKFWRVTKWHFFTLAAVDFSVLFQRIINIFCTFCTTQSSWRNGDTFLRSNSFLTSLLSSIVAHKYRVTIVVGGFFRK